MTICFYILGVLSLLIFWSASTVVTRKGAREEIQARGATNVGLITHKIANGTATLSDKTCIVGATVIGAFFSPMWLVASGILGSLLYLICHVWFGLHK